MKTKVSLFIVAAVFVAAVSFVLASPEQFANFGAQKVIASVAGQPVMGVQVVVELVTKDKDASPWRGARPTDDKGAAPFSNIDPGKYNITVKRFNKPTSSYNVAIDGSGGVKKAEVWDAAKKDSHKMTVELTGAESEQSINVLITTADAPAGE